MRIHLKTKQGKYVLFPSFRIPPRSVRSVSIIIFSLLLFGILYIRSNLYPLLLLFGIDLFSFPAVSFVVLLSHIPVVVYHKIRIYQATLRMRSRSDLLVVGITGSYGKTSTKEYLSTIVSSYAPTLKTEASKNSPIGIAEIILQKLTPQHKIFVVEMGAYKVGEIRSMCRIVKPQIGVILSINPQHQDLFGTIETTMKAKYELVENLSGINIGIFNVDDDRVRTMSEWAKRDGHSVWSVGTQDNKHALATPATFEISKLSSPASNIAFTISYAGTGYPVSARVLGVHQSTNISCAIAAAVALQMPIDKAVHAAKNIQGAPHVLEKVPGIHKSIFIDDTFNNNPDAAKAALRVLHTYKARKMLVFQPMIELGTYAKSSHFEVGLAASRVCDEVILVGDDWSEDFIKGVRSVPSQCRVQVLSVDAATAYLRTHIKASDTVLFKGKASGIVLTRLVSKGFLS